MIFSFQYKTIIELIIMKLSFTLGPQIQKIVVLTVMTGILRNRLLSGCFNDAQRFKSWLQLLSIP